MAFFERHVFICTNERPADNPKGSCKTRGSEDVLQRFKTLVGERGLTATVRAQKCGCLDYCSFGPTVVVYPDGVWYGRVTPQDVDEIVDSHLAGGVPVDRLRVPPDARRG
jgi:(2Fe-2S) ferredoxin